MKIAITPQEINHKKIVPYESFPPSLVPPSMTPPLINKEKLIN